MEEYRILEEKFIAVILKSMNELSVQLFIVSLWYFPYSERQPSEIVKEQRKIIYQAYLCLPRTKAGRY